MSRAHDRRIQYSRLTQENLLGNPQFFNRLPVHNTSSDEEGYSSESEAPQIRENVRNHSAAHARRIQYSLLTQENLLGNPQFFNRLPAHNTSSDDEGYSSASEAPQIRENVRNHSAAHARRIQYSLLTQENLLGNPQFFNRLPVPNINQNTSSDDEGYSSASEAPQNRNLY